MTKRHLYSKQVTASSEDVAADHPEREDRVTPRVRNNDANKFEDNVDVATHVVSPLDSLSLNDRPPSIINVEQAHRLSPPSAVKDTTAPLLLSPPSIPTSGLDQHIPASTSAGSSHLVLQQGHSLPPLRYVDVHVDSSPPSPAPPSSSAMSQREHFLIFIKILFKCLDQANEPEVRNKAKKIVAECTRRNRQGDLDFSPLMEAVEKRLRGFVGEAKWRRALLLLRHYVNKRNSDNDTINSSLEAASSAV
jgi:hypothetical protein